MIILVVGDKAKTFDNLSKLGYEVIELDTDGNAIKTFQADAPKEGSNVIREEYPKRK
jgi:hypothetical protein